MKPFCYALTLLLLIGATPLSIGCKKKNDKKECDGFPTVKGSVMVNGEELILVGAEVIDNSFGGYDNYLFIFNAIEDNCNTGHSLFINIEIPNGTFLNGVYPFVEEGNEGPGKATGSYLIETLKPLSSSSYNINFGSLSITYKGDHFYDYDFDINGQLDIGANLKMKVIDAF